VFAAATAEGGAVPLDRALAIVVAAAAGLHYAHTKSDASGRPLGIVHRDVTPSNVLVSYDGAVKLTDFGVAKWAAQSSETRHGTLKGKFPYMSPEQTRGEALDPRSDVFALGILLYELTTGTRLYEGASDFAVLSKIVNEDAPPPSTRVAEYPPELERVVCRALRRDREGRFESAQELQLALEEIARERRLNTSPVALAQYMHGLFGSKVAAWQAARHAGKTLAEHLVAVTQAEGPDDGALPDDVPLQRSVVIEGDGVSREARTVAPPQRARRRRWTLAAAGLAVAVVGAAAALAISRPDRTAPAAPAAAAEPPARAAPAPAGTPAPRVTPLRPAPALPAAAAAADTTPGPRADEAAPRPAAARNRGAGAKRPASGGRAGGEANKGGRARKAPAAAAAPASTGPRPAVKPAAKPPKWDPDSLVPPS
jgi:hypothetical protein